MELDGQRGFMAVRMDWVILETPWDAERNTLTGEQVAPLLLKEIQEKEAKTRALEAKK